MIDRAPEGPNEASRCRLLARQIGNVSTLVLLPLFAVSLYGAVKVTAETYREWPDSYRISNGVVELVVVPKIGRIMRFGFVGQRNLLWENLKVDGKTKVEPKANTNFGGDRLWPAPQSLWNWPPDPALDGSAWKAEVIANGVRMTSPVGEKIKVRFVREITLDALGPVANLHDRMDNLGTRMEMAAWEIAQTANPDSVVVPFEPAAGNLKGWHGYGHEHLDPAYHSLDKSQIILKRTPKENRKFGIFSSSGEINAYFGSTRLRSTSRVLRGQTYVDHNSPIQIYTNGDPDPFVEIEHTSPVQRMESGESVFLDVTWRLDLAR